MSDFKSFTFSSTALSSAEGLSSFYLSSDLVSFLDLLSGNA